MKILLVRLRQIGDVVFTTPAVRAIRQRYPGSRISYLVEPAAAAIVAGNPHVNEIIVAPRGEGAAGLWADLALGASLRRVRFDLAVDFHGGPRASLLTWLSGARERVGYQVAGRSWMYTRRVARPRELRARHSVENQWDLLGALGIPAPTTDAFPVEMTLDPDAAGRVIERLHAAGVSHTNRLVVLHVSAGNPFRRWPAHAFAEVAAALASRHHSVRVVVTSGPSESEAAAQVIAEARARLPAASGRQVLDCGEFSLPEIRALVEHASLYIGGDSGPMHVASTSAVPMVGLYGPTLPVRSAPWRAGPERSEAIEVEGLACRPCQQRTCEPGDFRCLTRIEPAKVIAAAERLMAGSA